MDSTYNIIGSPMNKNLSMTRIAKEEKDMTDNPIPNVIIKRKGDLVFHFCIYGLSQPYEGGLYHGRVELHSNYPFEPPKILMVTPSGRFTPDTPICTTFSHYHKESWSAAWSIRTIVLGFLSFMLENGSGIGSLMDNPAQKKAYAKKSIQFNKQNADFVTLFKADLKKLGIDIDKPAGKGKQEAVEPEEEDDQAQVKTGKGKKAKAEPKAPPKEKKIAKGKKEKVEEEPKKQTRRKKK